MDSIKWLGSFLGALLVLALIIGAIVFSGILGIVLGGIFIIFFLAALIKSAFEKE